MDITKMSVTELKALAFDTIVQIENLNKNLSTINREIAGREPEDKKTKAK